MVWHYMFVRFSEHIVLGYSSWIDNRSFIQEWKGWVESDLVYSAVITIRALRMPRSNLHLHFDTLYNFTTHLLAS